MRIREIATPVLIRSKDIGRLKDRKVKIDLVYAVIRYSIDQVLRIREIATAVPIRSKDIGRLTKIDNFSLKLI